MDSAADWMGWKKESVNGGREKTQMIDIRNKTEDATPDPADIKGWLGNTVSNYTHVNLTT